MFYVIGVSVVVRVRLMWFMFLVCVLVVYEFNVWLL